MNKYLRKVSSSTWRKRFLKNFYNIKGLEETIELANSQMLPTVMPYKMAASEALSLIKTYPINELAWARAHYNSLHLIEFWRWYNEYIDQWINRYNIDPDFPVFSVSEANSVPNLIHIPPHTITAQAEIYLTKKDHDALNIFFKGLIEKPDLQQLINKIIALHHIVKEGFEQTYSIFLQQQKKNKTEALEFYKVHRVLDNFLYVRKDGNIAGAEFSKIFFNSNLFYVLAFLSHKKTNHERLSIEDIREFLCHQRKYLAMLAIKNTLAENEILNHCMDKHYYDTEDGVVKTKITEKTLQYFQKNKIEAYNLKKLDGCPFAKTRGVETTALIEIFEYFDNILINYLQTDSTILNVFDE